MSEGEKEGGWERKEGGRGKGREGAQGGKGEEDRERSRVRKKQWQDNDLSV